MTWQNPGQLSVAQALKKNIYSSIAELSLSSYYEYCRDNYVYFKNKAMI